MPRGAAGSGGKAAGLDVKKKKLGYKLFLILTASLKAIDPLPPWTDLLRPLLTVQMDGDGGDGRPRETHETNIV